MSFLTPVRFNLMVVWVSFLFAGLGAKAQVGIGTVNPAPSAKLEVSSTSQGFLPPRLSSVQRDGISDPAEGLVIFNTTTGGLEIYTSGWKKLAVAGANSDITSLNGLSTQKLIKTVPGPINTLLYSEGDVVYDQSSGAYYFFKPTPAAQSSLGYNATDLTFGFNIGSKLVMRFKPNQPLLKSVTIHVNNANNAVLSVFSELNPCDETIEERTSVKASSIMGSSSPNSGSGNVTFTFSTPVTVTPNTFYYMTFDDIASVNSIGVKSGSDPAFSISYGGCSIDVGVSPGIQLNYANYTSL